VIRVGRSGTPASLDGPESVGGLETAAAVAYYSQTPPVGVEPDFTAYRGGDVRLALETMFGPKCAYCETQYASGNSPETEHYRPKKEIERGDKTRIEAGYYWLAASWSNLLPTCVFCNRRRKHRYEDGTRTTGKGIQFPLLDESRRATKPGEEQAEEPLLLDPTVDDPNEHLRFGQEAVVSPAPDGAGTSRRGEATIDVLGLNRPGLVHDRQDHMRWLELAIERFRRAVDALEQKPGDPYVEEQRDFALEEMRERARGSQPYAAMIRQRLAELLE
jgi:uncharacterized protein (TIGR02646 family)